MLNTTKYGIVIDDGTAMQGKGVCKEVIVELPQVTVLENFLPLDLGQIDIILGMLWLRTMGYMGVDWPNLTMTFTRGEVKVVLRGDATLTKAEVTMKTLISDWETEDEGGIPRGV